MHICAILILGLIVVVWVTRYFLVERQNRQIVAHQQSLLVEVEDEDT